MSANVVLYGIKLLSLNVSNSTIYLGGPVYGDSLIIRRDRSLLRSDKSMSLDAVRYYSHNATIAENIIPSVYQGLEIGSCANIRTMSPGRRNL